MNNYCQQKSLMEAKNGGWKYDEKQDSSIASKVSPHMICINYKKKNSHSTAEKPGRLSLKWGVKTSTTDAKTHQDHAPADVTYREEHGDHFCGVCVKKADLHPLMQRLTQIEGCSTKWKITSAYMWQSHERKRRRNFHRRADTRQVKSIGDPGEDPGPGNKGVGRDFK